MLMNLRDAIGLGGGILEIFAYINKKFNVLRWLLLVL